jgi:hypothetical protein
MKRTNQMQDGIPSFWSSSSSWNRATRSDRRSEYWSVGVLHCQESRLAARNFCGLSLEVSARTVINNETVLPKAAETAGIMKPRLSLGVASVAFPRRAVTKSLERRVVSKQ